MMSRITLITRASLASLNTSYFKCSKFNATKYIYYNRKYIFYSQRENSIILSAMRCHFSTRSDIQSSSNDSGAMEGFIHCQLEAYRQWREKQRENSNASSTEQESATEAECFTWEPLLSVKSQKKMSARKPPQIVKILDSELSKKLVSHAEELRFSDLNSIHQQLKDEDLLKVRPLNVWPVHFILSIRDYGTQKDCLTVGRLLFQFSLSLPHIPNIGPYVYYITLLSTRGGPEHHDEIWDVYNALRKEYEILDLTSVRRLIPALCGTPYWQESIKLLDMINRFYSSRTGGVINSIIMAAVRERHYDTAMQLLQDPNLKDGGPSSEVYEAFFAPSSPVEFGYSVLKYLMQTGWALPSQQTALYIKQWFERQETPRWTCGLSSLNGLKCSHCSAHLQMTSLSKEEFANLRSLVMEKVVVRGDIFRNSTPQEIKTFLKFVATKGPFDVVIDGMNVLLSGSGKSGRDPNTQSTRLYKVILQLKKYFGKHSRILVLVYHRALKSLDQDIVNNIKSEASVFTTSPKSKDDPFFVYAALYSGPNTHIVSNDQLRDHSFMLGPEYRVLFTEWQRTRQIQFSVAFKNDPTKFAQSLKLPEKHKNCVHCVEDGWHIPYNTGEQSPSFCKALGWLCAYTTKNNI